MLFSWLENICFRKVHVSWQLEKVESHAAVHYIVTKELVKLRIKFDIFSEFGLSTKVWSHVVLWQIVEAIILLTYYLHVKGNNSAFTDFNGTLVAQNKTLPFCTVLLRFFPIQFSCRKTMVAPATKLWTKPLKNLNNKLQMS